MGSAATWGTGRYEKTIAEASEAIALDPDMNVPYFNIAFANLYLGRLDDVDKALQRAAERKVDLPDTIIIGHLVAFLREPTRRWRRARARRHRPADRGSASARPALATARDGRL